VVAQSLLLGFKDSQALQRAIAYALQPPMLVLSGAGYTVPRAFKEPKALTLLLCETLKLRSIRKLMVLAI
jgi:hypothetical protein